MTWQYKDKNPTKMGKEIEFSKKDIQMATNHMKNVQYP